MLWDSDRPHDLACTVGRIGKLWEQQAFLSPTKARSDGISRELDRLIREAEEIKQCLE